MDPGKTDQEYTALDKVLVGIPNDTIGNPCASETIQSSVLPSFEPTSAHELNKSSASTNLCGLFNTEAVKVCDSNPLDNILPKTLFDQDDNSYNYHRALPMSVSQDASESPNNQSLALSFMNLGLKDRFAVMQSELDLLYQKDYSPFITENKSCRPNRHTRVTDEHDYDYGKLMELNFCDPRSISGDHKEQWQSFPNYPATMPINPWMHTCFPPTGVSEQESEFPSSSFQQQYYMESPYHANMPHQQQNRFNMLQCEMKDDRNYRRHPEQHCLKNLEHQCPEGHIRRRINSGTGQFSGNAMQSFFHVPIPHQAEQESLRSYENANVDNNRHNQLHPSFVSSNHARCHPNGFSGQCKSMLLAQAQSLPPACGLYGHSIGSHGNQVLDRFGKQTFPEKVLTRSHGLTSLRISESGSLGNRRLPEHANNTRRITPNSNVHNHLVQYDESLDLDVGRSLGSYSYSPDKNHYQLAKDQRYWQSLQSIIDKGNREDFDNVFLEIIGHVVEATTDPSGNYLVQKLVAVCTEEQKMQLISKISQSSSELLRISCNQHGTRVVQKIIETMKDPEQSSTIVTALKPCIVSLIKNNNGSHVAQRCLQYLSPKYREQLFEAAITNCIELARDRHGCCVLQKCLSDLDGEQKDKLTHKLASKACTLAEDPFGNYVVQFILEQEIPWATNEILDKLEGHYQDLSVQKCSSNVVEKCLMFAGDERLMDIIRELTREPQFLQIVLDRFGNYVVQSALRECKGPVRATLNNAIRLHERILCANPYGKRVLSSPFYGR